MIVACVAVAGLAQADVVTKYMKPQSANLKTGALDGTTASAMFEYSANNAIIQMTLLATGGNIWGDDSIIGVGNNRINSSQGITVSFNVIADDGYQLNALSFDRVRYNASDAGSTYTFTDNAANQDPLNIGTDSGSQYFGFTGGANVTHAFSNVAALTKDNQGAWSLHGTTGANTYAISDFKVTTDVSVIPEPITLGLFSMASVVLIGIRRFKIR